VVEIARQIILELGDLDALHMAMLAISGKYVNTVDNLRRI
jgi:hypothetical protein